MHFRGDTQTSIHTEQRVGGPLTERGSPLQGRVQAGQEAGGQEGRRQEGEKDAALLSVGAA